MCVCVCVCESESCTQQTMADCLREQIFKTGSELELNLNGDVC